MSMRTQNWFARKRKTKKSKKKSFNDLMMEEEFR